MTDTSELYHLVKLALVEQIGPATAKRLISYLGGAEAALKASKKEVTEIEGIGLSHYNSLHAKDTSAQAEEVLNDCDKRGIKVLSYLERDYPHRLKNCMDSPIVMYYDGDSSPLNQQRMVSIVGTRSATRYGIEFTEALVKKLAERNVAVVSGLAYGVDAAAHKNSLKFGTPTIGVVAHGLDHVAPSQHKSLAAKMKETGGLLSEHRTGVKVEKGFFPMRNRIVAGMSDATIVIESDIRGGSLITARMANDYNRDVFALPGRIHDQYSRGCNALIQGNQAHVLNDIDTFLTLMNWNEEKQEKERQIPLFVDLDGKEQFIYDLLAKDPKAVDLISVESELPMSQVSATLLSLEFKGLVKALPGKCFAISTYS